MSLLATSYRYEIEGGRKKALRKALARQELRIKEDEKYAERDNTVASERFINEVSKWSDNLDETSYQRTAKRERGEIKEELRLGGNALLKVRRAQLQQLLLEEQAQYKKELNQLGLTFYQERL